MRKLIALLLILVLCLSGCGAKESTASHTYGDLTIQIPSDYTDLSDEAFAANLDFVFGRDPIAVNGLREEKATFEAYGLQLSLEDYGTLLLKSNNVGGTLTQKDGIHTFSYTAGDFTYVVTLWETEDAFWTVQAYCSAADYGSAKDEMWQILSSVTL